MPIQEGNILGILLGLVAAVRRLKALLTTVDRTGQEPPCSEITTLHRCILRTEALDRDIFVVVGYLYSMRCLTGFCGKTSPFRACGRSS